jgi:uncharacterized protein YkwD
MTTTTVLLTTFATVLIVVLILMIIVYIVWKGSEGFNVSSASFHTIKGDYTSLEKEIIVRINFHRHLEGKIKLVENDILSMIIKKHMNNCARYQKVSHDGAQERFSDIKEILSSRRLGELVAYGNNNPKKLVETFLKSPTHSKLILGDYTNIGLATIEDDKKVYIGIILMK